MVQPVIKWSGSKRSQAEAIVSYIERDYGTYYEPFCGSCAVMARILSEAPGRFRRYVASDLNADLISAYDLVKSNPGAVVSGYGRMWREMNCEQNTIEDKKKYFEKVRARLNESHDPVDFIFVMRTTTNGMPRYNSNGEFNNSFHVTRNGINPDKFGEIVLEWSRMLNMNDVEFKCCSFDEIAPSENDFMYLDPPYANTKGMYFGGFDSGRLFEYLRGVGCDWMMSYDGIAGDESMVADVPGDLYRRHEMLASGNSSFRRVMGKDRHCDVMESLYLGFDGGEKGQSRLF